MIKKLKRYILTLSLLFMFLATKSQVTTKPKLVVGIIVDQMRADYIARYQSNFGNGGFKRFLNEGFNFENNHYHYASTVTGPGHAHVFNGSVPSLSGIVGNNWTDKTNGKNVYVADDSTVTAVGNASGTSGKMSPANLKVSSIADQLRIATQFKSKTIGIAIKDRGAILPVGGSGTAFWYDVAKSNWISSTYYMEKLPTWVDDFNNKNLPTVLTKNLWTLSFPLDKYRSSEADDQAYENNLSGETKPVFPHKMTPSNLATTPAGNELTTRFAMATISSEKLGKDSVTDLLAVSYSSPDYAGHAFGPQSLELEDMYIKLDKNLEQLFLFLDKEVGKGQYTVFLTADHGVAEIPAFLRKNKIKSGLFVGTELQTKSEKILAAAYGEGSYLINEDNYQLYVNHKTLESKKLTINQITQTLRLGLTKEEGIYDVVNLAEGQFEVLTPTLAQKLKGLYNPKRSGEIMILPEPAWFSGYTKGTTHGTPYSYDTHVPLLFFGAGIKKGKTLETSYICDIAPTLAGLLQILEPNGNVGKPLTQALNR